MTSRFVDASVRPRARRGGDNVDGLGDLSTDALREEVLVLAGRLAAGTYALLRLIGEIDARGVWACWGALSCAAWLADATEVELSTARSQVRVARMLRSFALVDAAMRDGEISYAKARVLAAAIDADNEADLVALALCTPAGRLGAAIAARAQRTDDPEVIAARQRDARSVSWRTEPDGTVVLTARLTPAAAGAVCVVIDAVVTGAGAPAGAPGEPGCSLAQQRADALVGIVTEPSGEGGKPGVQTEVVVHVRADGNALEDGTPLADHTVTAMLPDAFVSLLVHDSERQPIDASPRRRFPTRRQQRVIDARQHECAHAGCHATRFLQYDHIESYATGGPTVLANLQRLCGPHNRAKGQGRAERSREAMSSGRSGQPDAA